MISVNYLFEKKCDYENIESKNVEKSDKKEEKHTNKKHSEDDDDD